MLIENIRPKIRYADKMEFTARRRTSMTYDARMLYIIDGSGVISVDGTEKKLERGLLIMFQSGTPYKFTPATSFSAYAIDFDPIGDYPTTEGFYTPVSPRFFNKELMHEHVHFDNSELLSHPFMESVRPSVAESIRILVEEYKSEKMFCKARAELMLAEVILDVARRFSSVAKSGRSAAKVNEYITEHCLEPLTNAQIARAFGHEPCYLNRIVKQHTGYSIHKLIIKKRVEEGVKLLISTDLTMEEIAEKCGFCSAAHFSKRCKSVTGNPPSFYKKSSN